MADEETTATDTDIFKTLKATNDQLVEVLERQQQAGPTYVQPAPPAPAPKNYLLYIGIGLLALILFKKVKVKI